MVQWLRLHASTSGDMDLIPGLGTKIPHALPQKREKKNVCVCVCVCVCVSELLTIHQKLTQHCKPPTL